MPCVKINEFGITNSPTIWENSSSLALATLKVSSKRFLSVSVGGARKASCDRLRLTIPVAWLSWCLLEAIVTTYEKNKTVVNAPNCLLCNLCVRFHLLTCSLWRWGKRAQWPRRQFTINLCTCTCMEVSKSLYKTWSNNLLFMTLWRCSALS